MLWVGYNKLIWTIKTPSLKKKTANDLSSATSRETCCLQVVNIILQTKQQTLVFVWGQMYRRIEDYAKNVTGEE